MHAPVIIAYKQLHLHGRDVGLQYGKHGHGTFFLHALLQNNEYDTNDAIDENETNDASPKTHMRIRIISTISTECAPQKPDSSIHEYLFIMTSSHSARERRTRTRARTRASFALPNTDRLKDMQFACDNGVF
jgi:hypothetical protein